MSWLHSQQSNFDFIYMYIFSAQTLLLVFYIVMYITYIKIGDVVLLMFIFSWLINWESLTWFQKMISVSCLAYIYSIYIYICCFIIVFGYSVKLNYNYLLE